MLEEGSHRTLDFAIYATSELVVLKEASHRTFDFASYATSGRVVLEEASHRTPNWVSMDGPKKTRTSGFPAL